LAFLFVSTQIDTALAVCVAAISATTAAARSKLFPFFMCVEVFYLIQFCLLQFFGLQARCPPSFAHVPGAQYPYFGHGLLILLWALLSLIAATAKTIGSIRASIKTESFFNISQPPSFIASRNKRHLSPIDKLYF
jgi:hypothetical protein